MCNRSKKQSICNILAPTVGLAVCGRVWSGVVPIHSLDLDDINSAVVALLGDIVVVLIERTNIVCVTVAGNHVYGIALIVLDLQDRHESGGVDGHIREHTGDFHVDVDGTVELLGGGHFVECLLDLESVLGDVFLLSEEGEESAYALLDALLLSQQGVGSRLFEDLQPEIEGAIETCGCAETRDRHGDTGQLATLFRDAVASDIGV